MFATAYAKCDCQCVCAFILSQSKQREREKERNCFFFPFIYNSKSHFSGKAPVIFIRFWFVFISWLLCVLFRSYPHTHTYTHVYRNTLWNISCFNSPYRCAAFWDFPFWTFHKRKSPSAVSSCMENFLFYQCKMFGSGACAIPIILISKTCIKWHVDESLNWKLDFFVLIKHIWWD